MKGQGATEYLVLLAVVLIVALVSVALLGFFPGMASDAQITQSQMYWKSASPIAIVDVKSIKYGAQTYSPIYMKLRNNGAYPIRITKVIAPPNYWLVLLWDDAGPKNISEYFYLSPGEEMAFATRYGNMNAPSDQERRIHFSTSWGGGISNNVLDGAKQFCTDASSYVNYDSFGFEYIEYIEGQQVTKREIGAKPLFFKCN